MCSVLFQEYEEQSSPEACYVKDLDRFDMILQAFEYEQADNTPGKLQEFFDSTQGNCYLRMVRGYITRLYA